MNAFLRFLLESDHLATLFSGSGRLTHGFWRGSIEGHHALFHSGDTLGYSTLVVLIPEQELTIFVSYNRLSHGLRFSIAEEIVRRVAVLPQPVDGEETATPHSAKSGAELRAWAWELRPATGAITMAIPAEGEVDGNYRSLRFPHRSVAKLVTFGNLVRVGPSGADGIAIDGETYTPAGSGAFVASESQAFAAFGRAADGTIYLARLGDPTTTYRRASLIDHTLLHVLLLALSLVAFFTGAARLLVRRPTSAEKIGLGTASLVGLAVVATTTFAFADAAGFVFGQPPLLRGSVWLARLFVASLLVATAVWVAKTIRAKRRGGALFAGRLVPLVVLLGGALFSLFLFYWRLY